MSLLARLKSRPTSRVGTQRTTDRKRDAEPSIDAFKTIEPKSWLSTQVYTPFGRLADRRKIFFDFLKSRPIHFRKVVCQKCKTNATNAASAANSAQISNPNRARARSSFFTAGPFLVDTNAARRNLGLGTSIHRRGRGEARVNSERDILEALDLAILRPTAVGVPVRADGRGRVPPERRSRRTAGVAQRAAGYLRQASRGHRFQLGLRLAPAVLRASSDTPTASSASCHTEAGLTCGRGTGRAGFLTCCAAKRGNRWKAGG